MKKNIFFAFLILLIFLFSCEQNIIEKGYVIPPSDDEEIDEGPVFDTDIRDGEFIVQPLSSDIDLSVRRIFSEPTTVTVGTTRSDTYVPARNGFPRYRNFTIGGNTYLGEAYRAVFHDVCRCGHADYYDVTYRIPDYVYIYPEPTAWDHDEGYIAPKVIKYKSGASTIYRMWFTKVYRHYDNSLDGRKTGYKKYNYVYETMCSSSADGVNWQNPTSTPASYYENFIPDPVADLDDRGGVIVSDIIQESDSYYTAYYIAKNVKSSENKGWKMYTAYSTNSEPTDWIRGSGLYKIIDTAAYAGFDLDSISTGNSIKEDEIYKMWYMGIAGNKAAIGYASSVDAFSYWNKYSSDPVYKGKRGKFDQLSVNDPYVIKDNGLYKMFYSGYNGTRYQLGLAYSYDGMVFGYYDKSNYEPFDLVAETEDIRYPYVLIDTDVGGNKIYRMYYSIKDASGVWRIRMATSSSTMD